MKARNLHRSRAFFLCFLAAFLVWGIGEVARGDSAYNIVTETKKVPGLSLRSITASATYPYKESEVWSLLSEFDQFASYSKRVIESTILKVEGKKTYLYVFVDLPWPFPNLWNKLEIVSDQQAGKFQWRQIEGNTKVNQGVVQLKEQGRVTELFLEAQVDPGHFVPQSAVSWGAKKLFPKILQRIGGNLWTRRRNQSFKENPFRGIQRKAWRSPYWPAAKEKEKTPKNEAEGKREKGR